MVNPGQHGIAQKALVWTSVPISVMAESGRIDAGFFCGAGPKIRNDLRKGKYPLVNLCGADGLARAYTGAIFKKIAVEKSDFPIYQPSQINEISPAPSAYLSEATKTDFAALRVKPRQVLVTCSGSVGDCTYVGRTLSNMIFSQDLIRIEANEYPGYVYAYLKSAEGKVLLNTSHYGAVISHINPKHLDEIPIPNPPDALKRKIHALIEKSFNLRDQSNDLTAQAQSALREALKLPSIEDLHRQARQFDKSAAVLNYSVPFSALDNRLDASYHVPIVNVINKLLLKGAETVTRIGDNQISKQVILPGRFKRVYVEEGNGTVFIGGKQILELDPANKKYLSRARHADRIEKELALIENSIVVTCSGTVGKVAIVPRHWSGWAANQHIIRIIPANKAIAGYLYAWLSSDYGKCLIKRYIYGAVIDEIDSRQMAEVAVPLCRDSALQKSINDQILQANRKRGDAYDLEKKALAVLHDEVLYASNR